MDVRAAVAVQAGKPLEVMTVQLEGPRAGEVLVDKGRAVGVLTESGETLHARAVVANVNPKLLYERLMSPNAVPAPTRERVTLPAGYKPSAKEEYMGPMQLEYFRQRLLQWKDDLVEESKQTIENLKEEVRDVGDEAERASRESENSLELRTRDRYRKLISKIDSTLKRIEDGSYGYCVDTGEEIGLERLEARLTAERTIDAQERWEHRQKQMGE